MRRLWIFATILALLVVFTGCADDALAPSSAQEGDTMPELSEYQAYPAFLTGSGLAAVGAFDGGTAAHTKNSGGFTGPLFGLTTAPNGDILVADAGDGIATLDGHTDITLPGVSDMSPIGRRSLWALVGLTGEPTTDTGQGLYRVSNGKNRLIVDLFDFEEANDPDGAGVDSNPFDVQSLGGQAAVVVDAGGNTLLQVSNQGRVEVLAVFPTELVSTANFNELAGCPPELPLCAIPAPAIPAQAVPTSIAVGPDGYYYVGELKGFPAPTDASNIWKVAPDASGDLCPNPNCQKVFDGGFTSIIDMAFGEDGQLYVLEFDERSWAAVEIFGIVEGGTINACDIGTGSCNEVATGIPIPTAITFGKDGALWHTQNALVPGGATVELLP